MNLIQKIKRRILIRRVNRALNIELFDWQIAYIFDNAPAPESLDEHRRTGKTTAAILKLLLNPSYKNTAIGRENPNKYPRGSSPFYAESVRIARLYGEDGVTLRRRHIFIYQLREIQRQLRRSRIKVNNIIIKF